MWGTKLLKPVFVSVACLQLAACASIVRGTDNPVQFVSEPSGASVSTSNGRSCPATPCTIQMPRKDSFVATFSMPGYHSEQVSVNTVLSGGGAAGMAGNIVAGGIIGVGVDAYTGAGNDHSPNPVIARLRPAGGRPAARRRAPIS